MGMGLERDDEAGYRHDRVRWEASERADMGGECHDDSWGAWQFVQFSSTVAPLNRVAILVEAKTIGRERRGFLIGLHAAARLGDFHSRRAIIRS